MRDKPGSKMMEDGRFSPFMHRFHLKNVKNLVPCPQCYAALTMEGSQMND